MLGSLQLTLPTSDVKKVFEAREIVPAEWTGVVASFRSLIGQVIVLSIRAIGYDTILFVISRGKEWACRGKSNCQCGREATHGVPNVVMDSEFGLRQYPSINDLKIRDSRKSYGYRSLPTKVPVLVPCPREELEHVLRATYRISIHAGFLEFFPDYILFSL